MILLTNHRDLVPQFLGLTVRHLIFGQIVDNTIKRRKKELIEFTEIASLPLIFTSSWIHMLLDKEDRTNINILIYIYMNVFLLTAIKFLFICHMDTRESFLHVDIFLICASIFM